MNYNYEYKSIRPRLYEVLDEDGTVLGRIRHEFLAEEKRMGWQSSDGEFYPKAEDAAVALIEARREKIAARYAS